MPQERDWKEILKEELEAPYFQELKKAIIQEKKRGAVIYPPEPLIFRAFSATPFDKVSVVIMGQDPYHGEGQALGLSFSVPCGMPLPPSLRNIFQELQDDVGCAPVQHGCLSSWADQGVLLLNATLTVRKGEPKSHYGMGWERFTDAVIAALYQREEPVVFVLWGKSAQEKCARVITGEKEQHLVLTAAHPSPYSAHSGFFGCRHFSQINLFLKKAKRPEIAWDLGEKRCCS